MAIKLQIRRGTASNWTSSNPTLESGEIGFETDTGNVKIGDGATAWTSLGYVSSTYPQVTVAGTDINAAGYRAQGRYLIGTGVTSNVPSAWTPASDAPAVLHVTALSGGSVTHVLVSTKTQKAFARGWDGSGWTIWVAVSQYAGSITATELASDAVETAKIKDATTTTDGVTDAKLRQSTALTVIGRSANSTGAPADIAAGSNGHVLRRSGTTLGFGTLASGAFDANTDIPLTAIANIATARLIGNNTGSAAAPIELTAAQVKTLLAYGSMADETKTNYLNRFDNTQAGAFVLAVFTGSLTSELIGNGAITTSTTSLNVGGTAAISYQSIAGTFATNAQYVYSTSGTYNGLLLRLSGQTNTLFIGIRS